MDERIKELAEQAGLDPELIQDNQLRLDDFAELIRQDEAKACAKHYLEIMRDAVEQARLEEREACAKLCESYDKQSWFELTQEDTAAAIRQRGDK